MTPFSFSSSIDTQKSYEIRLKKKIKSKMTGSGAEPDAQVVVYVI